MRDRKMLLEAFTRAWSDRDVEALMSLMAPDCEFRCSVGPEPGFRFTGREDVRRGFSLFLGPPVGAPPETESNGELVADDFAVTRWTTHSQLPDASVVRVQACDVFEFEGDLIKVKDTYRKVLGPPPGE